MRGAPELDERCSFFHHWLMASPDIIFNSANYRIPKAALIVMPAPPDVEVLLLHVDALLAPCKIPANEPRDNPNLERHWWNHYRIGGRWSGLLGDPDQIGGRLVPDIGRLGDVRDNLRKRPPARLIGPELYVSQPSPLYYEEPAVTSEILAELDRLSDDLTVIVVDASLADPDEQHYPDHVIRAGGL